MPIPTPKGRWRIALWTALALVAFASNSVLCRLALGRGIIDAASFATIRILSGAIMLVGIVLVRQRSFSRLAGRWWSAFGLASYAVPFSFAYTTLSTGTGALILFGAVQLTMLTAAVLAGETLRLLQWIGLTAAILGLVYLVLPGLTAPSPVGSALMTIAGVAWGIYSLKGRKSTNPLSETAGNFLRAAPIVLVVSAATLRNLHVNSSGVALAILSGALASGLGYAIWYSALAGLTSMSAATVQLIVPILAAMGGVAFLGEGISLRITIAAVLVFGGVGLSLRARH